MNSITKVRSSQLILKNTRFLKYQVLVHLILVLSFIAAAKLYCEKKELEDLYDSSRWQTKQLLDQCGN